MSSTRTTVRLLLISLAIVLLADPLSGQVDVTRIKKPAALKVAPGTLLPVLPIALEVQIQDDEFGQKWGNEYRETDPLPLRFRWRRGTGIEDPSVAEWQVTSASAPTTILARGPAQVPSPGELTVFDIDFRPIVGGSTQRPLIYYVRLAVQKDVRYGGTPPPPKMGGPVKVVFVSSGPPTVFTFEGLNPELSASMPIAVRLQNLWSIGDTDIEPYLLVAVVYIDGTTIIPEIDVAAGQIRFTNSHVRISKASGTHGNVLSGGSMGWDDTVPIPTSTGLYETTIRPIGLELANQYGRPESEKRMLREFTEVGILVIGMEEDAIPTTETANELYDTFIGALQAELDGLLRGVVMNAGNPQSPDLDPAIKEIRDRLRKSLKELAISETIGDVEGYLGIPGAPLMASFGALNADDFIGAADFSVTYQDLLDAGETGIPFKLTVTDNPDEVVEYQI
ncbi:MAG: hypothetical protein ACRELU_12355, partial [Gemmatimonadota bacterium]